MPAPLWPYDSPPRSRSPRDRRLRRRRALRRLAALCVLVLAGVAVVLAAATAASRTGHATAVAAGRPALDDAVGTLVGPGARRLLAPLERPDLRLRESREIARTLARTPYVSVAGPHRREVALTFDDGPGPYTLGVVSELERLHVPATFFQIGFMIALFPEAERALLRDPDVALADHTRTHPFMGRLPAVLQAQQIDDEAALARRFGVHGLRLFRPPYGSFDADTFRLLRRRRMLMVLWTADSEDYRQPGVDAIVRNVLGEVRPGAIVLMHDAGGTRTQTIAALPVIVHTLRREGYRLVTVPRLLLDDPASRHQPRAPGGAG